MPLEYLSGLLTKLARFVWLLQYIKDPHNPDITFQTDTQMDRRTILPLLCNITCRSSTRPLPTWLSKLPIYVKGNDSICYIMFTYVRHYIYSIKLRVFLELKEGSSDHVRRVSERTLDQPDVHVIRSRSILCVSI